MGRMSELHAELMWEEGEYVPSNEEMKAAALHHTLTQTIEALKETPAEYLDLDKLYELEDRLVVKIQQKLEGSK